jgi:hypothetical protein
MDKAIQINKLFTLEEIGRWHVSKNVDLPKVQRGFVWKANQIEDLWDSLLRRYPVGSFVLFPKSDTKFELLDGQQRATAICLGFGNPTFKGTENKIKIFIDLERPSGNDNRKYYFRVINKSHPWGYDKVDNKKTLDANMRREAMLLYGIDDYKNVNLDNFFPYDCSVPVPLDILLNAAINKVDVTEIYERVCKWPLWQKSIASWFNWMKQNPSLTDHPEAQELKDIHGLEKSIMTVYLEVIKMLNYYHIPAITLDLEEHFKVAFTSTVNNEVKFSHKDNEEDNSNNEIENLFLRLNSGGTPLRGEDLNYSILKAHISMELQENIEKVSFGFAHPSRLITLCFKLFQHKKKEELKDGINMKIKPKEFQKTIHCDLKKFESFLVTILNDKFYQELTFLEYVCALLDYNKVTNKIGLPHILRAKIAETAPEVMFMLLYRILLKNDRFDPLSIEHRNMLGMITLFMWLGKGEGKKDHSKLLRNIWPTVIRLNTNQFWSSATTKRAMMENVLPDIPYYNKSRNQKRLLKISEYQFRKDSSIFDKYKQETGFSRFIDKMFFNRDLILYAQREFLSEMFTHGEYYLEDTNQPFDWDHISPKRLTLKHGIPFIIKDWYESIGNLRAWPYSLNRSDQDVVPAKKFDPVNPKWKTEKNQLEFEKGKSQWLEFISKNQNLINSIADLKKKLLEWSHCEPNWSYIENDDLRFDWQEVYENIRNRGLGILGIWYENFNIENLIPLYELSGKDLLLDLIDLRYWELNASWVKNHPDFDTQEYYNWSIKQPIHLKGSNINLYIIYKKDGSKMLGENEIIFGLLHNKNENYVSSLNIAEKLKNEYDTDNIYYVQGYTTLISTMESSRIELIKSFRKWLGNKIFKDSNPYLVDAFDKSLKKSTQTKIYLSNIK